MSSTSGDLVIVRHQDGSGYLFTRADAQTFLAANHGAGYSIEEAQRTQPGTKMVRQSDTEDKAVDPPARRPGRN